MSRIYRSIAQHVLHLFSMWAIDQPHDVSFLSLCVRKTNSIARFIARQTALWQEKSTRYSLSIFSDIRHFHIVLTLRREELRHIFRYSTNALTSMGRSIG